MRRITALFILAGLSAIPAFSQEIPADLKTKLEAKAAELQPTSKSAAKTWLVKQMNAWESIQNLAFAADADDIEMIKKLADKKYPLDFVSQETFINEQAVAAGGLPDIKAQIGKVAYAAIKEKFDKDGKTDLNEFIALVTAQITAKAQLSSLKPLANVDEMTFTITKEVAAKKYPNDFISQLNAVKKFSNAADAADTAADAAESTTAAGGSGAAVAGATADSGQNTTVGEKRTMPVSLAELNIIAREQFTKHTLTAEGETKVTAIPTMMHNKQVVLIPFSVFTAGPNVTLMNTLAEPVEFDKENIYASKDFPFVIVVPKEIPATTTNAVFPADKDYREIIGKPIFFMGYTTTNVQIFPVKMNAVGEQNLILSSRVPNNFLEGTILMNPEKDITLGTMIYFKGKYPKVKWNDRNSVNRLRRAVEAKSPFLTCVRLDRLTNWEKVDFAKMEQQRKKLDSLNKLLWDFIMLNSSTRISDAQQYPCVGSVVSKYASEFKERMDKSRFERKFRSYIQDLTLLIKTEMRDMDVNSFYSVYRYDLEQTLDALNSVYKYYDSAIRGNSLNQLIPDDVKRMQNK